MSGLYHVMLFIFKVNLIFFVYGKANHHESRPWTNLQRTKPPYGPLSNERPSHFLLKDKFISYKPNKPQRDVKSGKLIQGWEVLNAIKVWDNIIYNSEKMRKNPPIHLIKTRKHIFRKRTCNSRTEISIDPSRDDYRKHILEWDRHDISPIGL